MLPHLLCPVLKLTSLNPLKFHYMNLITNITRERQQFDFLKEWVNNKRIIILGCNSITSVISASSKDLKNLLKFWVGWERMEANTVWLWKLWKVISPNPLPASVFSGFQGTTTISSPSQRTWWCALALASMVLAMCNF